MHRVLATMIVGVALLGGAIGQPESEVAEESVAAATEKATIEDLVEILWRNELECPFPNYRMTREAFGIAADKQYSFGEKVGLIYRAWELRRGQHLCIQEEGKQHKAMLNDSNIPIAQRKKMATGFTVVKYNLGFLETKKGKLMVAYLNSKVVGEDDLLRVVMQKESASQDKLRPKELEKAVKPLREMSREEQIDYLYGVFLERSVAREKARQERRDARAATQTENVQGKPPVKPWRANPKSRTIRARRVR